MRVVDRKLFQEQPMLGRTWSGYWIAWENERASCKLRIYEYEYWCEHLHVYNEKSCTFSRSMLSAHRTPSIWGQPGRLLKCYSSCWLLRTTRSDANRCLRYIQRTQPNTMNIEGLYEETYNSLNRDVKRITYQSLQPAHTPSSIYWSWMSKQKSMLAEQKKRRTNVLQR